MNVATYGFSLLAARLLGPVAFGEFSAAMGVLIIANVLALGLQAMAARRVSRAATGSATSIAPVVTPITRATRVAALGVLTLLLVLAPLGCRLLGFTSWVTPVAVAVAAALLAVMGGQAGVMQGARNWGRLTTQQLVFAAGRLGLAGAAVTIHPTTAVATAAVAVALLPVIGVGAAALRPAPGAPEVPGATEAPAPAGASALREALGDAHTLLAFFTFANLDPILVRAVTDEHRAGLVAGGLILTKAALFLPQFVLVVAFPGMATATSRAPLLRVLAAVAGLGVIATAGVLALPGLALQFIGGSRYAEVAGSMWAFTLLGTALALLQVVVYGALAGHGRTLSPLLWVGVVAAIALAAAPALTPAYLAWRGLGAAVVLVVALGLVLSGPRRATSAPPRH